ncbi:N-ethylammeline chlorohydrolase [Candidatus Magnetobacterium bavaricum]|uniref:5-methylthioadenosine/S-adenosylhomocysteine deaminase n=1 Tax=Candidatus Magnetobacterium bavaricum TaxID=29290 RepID=A0A0F3GIS4_9BACT|nr:N-ethylammeline chlorohydrolase [Candidatus Magnetobacterium bavaricum]
MVEVDYIIHGDYLLTMIDGYDPIVDGAIAVIGNKIIDVGTYTVISQRYRPSRRLGGAGKVVFPGLINTHTHAAMVYFRGMADDLPLKDWLEGYIWPAEGKWLSDEFIYDAVGLACLEMLLGGTTTYNDMYFFEGSAARAVKEMSMRAVLGCGVLDFPSASAKDTQGYLDNAERFIKDWHGDPLVVPCVAPHAPYTCSPDTFMKSKALAQRYNVPMHTHLSETQHEVQEIIARYGKRPVEHLYDIGFLDSRLVAAHCVWLSEAEIELLAENRVGVSHCIESNLKLASGVAPVVAMLERGVSVSFGTDSAASNNDLDLFTEMSIAARLHKNMCNNPTVLPAYQALTMATRLAAGQLGFGDSLGCLKPGYLADVVIADLNRPHLTPFYDIYSLIVYSMRSWDVDTVMVNGKVVVQGKKHTLKDEAAILDKALWWKNKIQQ